MENIYSSGLRSHMIMVTFDFTYLHNSLPSTRFFGHTIRSSKSTGIKMMINLIQNHIEKVGDYSVPFSTDPTAHKHRLPTVRQRY